MVCTALILILHNFLIIPYRRNLLEISSLLSSFISWPNAHRGSEINVMDNLVKPKTVVIVAQKAYCIAIEMLGHGQI